uniref:Uncharacterized protein n=1 Tax=Lactuca sativa TaxID=4236 RepID=A0A9R1VKR2_LACSA|nr:hypothetical protein LSAT_V11C500287510 [Lactuca sativa]
MKFNYGTKALQTKMEKVDHGVIVVLQGIHLVNTNSSPIDKFSITKCVRQGDSLCLFHSYYSCHGRTEHQIPWWCRLMNENERLWNEVIMSIHNLHNKHASYIARKSSNGVSCNISTAINYLSYVNIDIHHLFTLVDDLV